MFRRYNRWWSRFDQPDPYDGSYDLSDPQSFNRYAYTQNDPVNFVDPSGLNAADPGSPCSTNGDYINGIVGNDGKCYAGPTGSVTIGGGGGGIPESLARLIWDSMNGQTPIGIPSIDRWSGGSYDPDNPPRPPKPEQQIMGMSPWQWQQQQLFDDCARQALRSYRKTYVGTSFKAMAGGLLIGLGASSIVNGIPGTGGAMSIGSAGSAISHAPTGQNPLITTIVASHEAAASPIPPLPLFYFGGKMAANSMSEADQNVATLNAAVEDCKKKFPGAKAAFLNTNVVFSF